MTEGAGAKMTTVGFKVEMNLTLCFSQTSEFLKVSKQGMEGMRRGLSNALLELGQLHLHALHMNMASAIGVSTKETELHLQPYDPQPLRRVGHHGHMSMDASLYVSFLVNHELSYLVNCNSDNHSFLKSTLQEWCELLFGKHYLRYGPTRSTLENIVTNKTGIRSLGFFIKMATHGDARAPVCATPKAPTPSHSGLSRISRLEVLAAYLTANPVMAHGQVPEARNVSEQVARALLDVMGLDPKETIDVLPTRMEMEFIMHVEFVLAGKFTGLTFPDGVLSDMRDDVVKYVRNVMCQYQSGLKFSLDEAWFGVGTAHSNQRNWQTTMKTVAVGLPSCRNGKLACILKLTLCMDDVPSTSSIRWHAVHSAAKGWVEGGQWLSAMTRKGMVINATHITGLVINDVNMTIKM